MKRVTGDQGTLFDPATPSRPARPRRPPRQTTVTVDRDAITAATAGRIEGERAIAEAVRAARPDVADGFRVCILDSIKSDWWGITSSSDGKRPGLPFKILGGPRGHVPLHSSAGKVIGQLIGSGKLPLSIIDMADFEAGGLQRFFVDFAQSLMRSARGVIYLVIEEAHEFAPKERSGIGGESMAMHWAKKLATAGRSKGIRETLRGIARTHGEPARRSAALTTADIKKLVAVCGDDLAGLRDRALLLIGFAGVLRRSEIVGLDTGHVVATPTGLRLMIARSKTDPAGEGAEIGITKGAKADTCPVRSLNAWLAAAGIVDGPLFRRVTKDGTLGLNRLTPEAVRLILGRDGQRRPVSKARSWSR